MGSRGQIAVEPLSEILSDVTNAADGSLVQVSLYLLTIRVSQDETNYKPLTRATLLQQHHKLSYKYNH